MGPKQYDIFILCYSIYTFLIKTISKHNIQFLYDKNHFGDKECALQDTPFLFYFNCFRYEYNIYKYGECTYVLSIGYIGFCVKKTYVFLILHK